TSEVAWLFLIAFWVWALAAAAAAYAVWNHRGLTGAARVRPGRRGPHSPLDWLPDAITRTAPAQAPIFEGDEIQAEAELRSARSGNELFGVREYRRGDPLRRIHWRSSARHGRLAVREFEPPGVRVLGIFLDGGWKPADDQVARVAASEAWDCVRGGGRAVLWA